MDSYTVAELLRKHVTAQQVNDRRVALTFGGTHLSYDELDERSDRVANALLRHGFNHGDRVGMLLHNRTEWVEVFFAIAKIGGVVVPINHLLSPAEVAFILRDCGARWLVSEASFGTTTDGIDLGSDTPRLVLVDDGANGVFDYQAAVSSAVGDSDALPDRQPVRSDDLFLLQYTSGTTGSPKGAMHTHSTVLWNALHQIVDYRVTADDVFLVVPALCWAAGFHDLALATLWRGGRLVLSTTTGFSAERFLATVETERVTATLLVPTVLRRVLAASALHEHDLSSLRTVYSGGEPVGPAVIAGMKQHFPSCALIQAYGMSEFPTMMLYLDQRYAEQKPGSAGRACSAAEIRVVDESGKDTASGEIGEILCRSPATMIGYYRRPEASAEILANGWLHTGDLATVDQDGFVYIAGRAKDMIISGGLNVYPAEIELALAQHPSVLEAAVIGVADPDWGEVGHALVIRSSDDELHEDDMAEFLRRNIAHYKVPKYYTFSTSALPRTTSGKIQKFRVKEQLHALAENSRRSLAGRAATGQGTRAN
jgi:fatty-acyl-CoA synthase